MADTLLSFGVEKLWDLLVRETDRFEGVDEQVTTLRSDLNLLRSFLKDADAKKHSSAVVRYCVEEIKEIVYDAEDVIETFVLKEDLGKTGGVKKCMRRISCIVVDRREVALDMEGISKRISKVILDMKNLKVHQWIVDGSGYAETLEKRQREMRHTFPSDNESHLVGLEQKVTKLVGHLVEEESYQVISIIGMGGIGKTCLARQAFKHETIEKHFDGVVWVCVSQQFTQKVVWQEILAKLSSEDEKHGDTNMTENELQEKLFRMLQTRKCLIVLDDIWKEEDWDRINQNFPRTKGKVLLTSRNKGVALHADPNCIIINPKYLDHDESWTLLQKIAFPVIGTTEFNIDEMEKMGKQMLKQCGGLPLAIMVLGGLLAAQFTFRDWNRLNDNVGSHIVGGTSSNDRNINSVYHILYLSYEELPIYLKHCFLYLAHFPEDYTIEVKKLSHYWAAEGVQRPEYYERASYRDVADGFIEELVKRNMVVSERDGMSSRFETCQLHDMMREVCLLKAKEENFVQFIQGASNRKSPCKSRRLAVHVSDDETFHLNNPSLRSLLVIKPYILKVSELNFTRLQLMRVLDLSDAKFEGGKVPSSIGKLIHLRYLSLCDAEVTHLPSSMGNLKQLIYLNLDVDDELYMPNILKEMRELTYLYLPRGLHKKVKMGLGNLVNLETLENFSTKHGNVRDLQGMTRLQTLSILFTRRCSVETLSSCIGELNHLEYLTINDSEQHYNDEEKGFVLDCKNLRELCLRIYMPRLPDEQSFPSRLTTITLENCHLEEDPMPILEKLLHLKEVELEYGSFNGKGMVCSSGGFPQLQKLILQGLGECKEWIVKKGSMPFIHTLSISSCPKLEEWIVEEGSMPLLHTLQINYCWKLKELPNGLQFISSLKDVSVELSGEQWKNKFSEEHLPSCLTSITIEECRLEEDPMAILGKLLHLKEVELNGKSFNGKKMVCSRAGFPQLQKLTLCGLKELEEWKVEKGSMPLLYSLWITGCEKLEDWIVEEGSMSILHTLEIYHCHKLKELPNGLQFITSLQIMSLSNCHLEEDPMLMLEKLPHLKSVRLYPKSFCGRRIVCSRGGFPQLQDLELFGLDDLEEWIVEEGSMPLLHTLNIAVCQKLNELPDGLQFITSLKYLTLRGMKDHWKERLRKRGEDYYKVQHIPYVRCVLIYHGFYGF